MRCRLAAGLAVTAMLWLPTATPPPAARAASACTGWSNSVVPPPTIRVLRTSGTSAGSVEVVDFKKYVKYVMAWEWPSSWTAETLKAGAVAVKEYGWYYTMHYRGGTASNGCYDVVDTTTDQLYRAPDTAHPLATSLVNAVENSWAYSVTKNGSLFLTGYRAGEKVVCGTNADGARLFQWSAQDCGRAGKSMAEILAIYYYPNLQVVGPPPVPVAGFPGAPPGRQVTVGTSTQLGWTEEAPPGATIASRSASLLMTKAYGGRCGDRWMPRTPPWNTTAAPPQTLSGLVSGFCYRLVVKLTDSAGRTSTGGSGRMLADSLAPVATFTSPRPNALTAAGSTVTVTWTEDPAEGRTIAARSLVAEYAAAPNATSCTAATWKTLWTRTDDASPATASGLGRLTCYRFALTLTDSAGRSGTWMSGVFLTPPSF